MRAFFIGAVLAFSALIAAGSCSLDGEGNGSEFGQGNGTPQGGSGGTSQGIPCTDQSDCPEDGPCVVYSCNNSFCAPSFAPEGSEVPGSAQGDCLRETCVAGKVSAAVDETDAPAGDDCNDGSCVNGTPTVTPKANNTPCGAAGQGLTCSNGTCVGCDENSDCNAGVCENAVCDIPSTTCGKTNKPDGTIISDPSNTDCVRDECDGNGSVAVNRPDDDDVPNDMNPCTNDSCNGTIPQFLDKADGDTCPGGMFCYQGTCSQCGLPANCPDPDCQTPTCNGTCGTTNDPDGQACTTMGGQYCFSGTCSECAVTANCPPASACHQTPSCTNGTCTYITLPDGTACSPTEFCFNGMCSECGVDANCTTTVECKVPVCNAGTCGTADAPDNTMCGAGMTEVCCTGVCCAAGQVCTAGTCM